MSSQEWKELLAYEFEQDYYKKLMAFLMREYRAKEIYPPKEDVYNAFRLCPLSELKVIILGQDPYHGRGEAHGLAFSVREGVPLPPSLKNIFKEIGDNYRGTTHKNGDLSYLAEQGVLLLNACLTVEKDRPLSHRNQGWEIFTDAVIARIADLDRPLVFMLWGNYAKAKASFIYKKDHLVLRAAHPSPLSATRGFFGCEHFLLANEFLREKGLSEIRW